MAQRCLDPKAWLPAPVSERPASPSPGGSSEVLSDVSSAAPGSANYDIFNKAPTGASIEVTWRNETQLFENVSEIARFLTRLELHLNVPQPSSSSSTTSKLAVEMQAEANRASSDAYYSVLDPRRREEVIQLAHQQILERLRGLLDAVEPCGATVRCGCSFGGDLLTESPGLDMRLVALGKPILDWIREQRGRLGLRKRNMAPGKTFDEQFELWRLLPDRLRVHVKPPGEGPAGPGFLKRWHDALRSPEFQLAQMEELKMIQESAGVCRAGETSEEGEGPERTEKNSTRPKFVERLASLARSVSRESRESRESYESRESRE